MDKRSKAYKDAQARQVAWCKAEAHRIVAEEALRATGCTIPFEGFKLSDYAEGLAKAREFIDKAMDTDQAAQWALTLERQLGPGMYQLALRWAGGRLHGLDRHYPKVKE